MRPLRTKSFSSLASPKFTRCRSCLIEKGIITQQDFCIKLPRSGRLISGFSIQSRNELLCFKSDPRRQFQKITSSLLHSKFPRRPVKMCSLNSVNRRVIERQRISRSVYKWKSGESNPHHMEVIIAPNRSKRTGMVVALYAGRSDKF